MEDFDRGIVKQFRIMVFQGQHVTIMKYKLLQDWYHYEM